MTYSEEIKKIRQKCFYHKKRLVENLEFHFHQ